MTPQTISLTALSSSVAVTVVSLMVPNAIDARPVNDATVERGYFAALASAAIIGFAVGVLDGTPFPLFGALFCGVLVVAAHNSISRNGMALA